MEYIEIGITIQLREPVYFGDSFELLSKLMARAMSNDESLLDIHRENRFVPFVISGLYPTEASKEYLPNKPYTFHLRIGKEEYLFKFLKCLQVRKDHKEYQIIDITTNYYNYNRIMRLKSITPVVITTGANYYWTDRQQIDILTEQLHINLLKKYREFYGALDEPKHNFIETISLINRKPMKINYKQGGFWGNKFDIKVREDEVSQKLAFTALTLGLGEKNGIGCGYCSVGK